jgi:hypothetical protein
MPSEKAMQLAQQIHAQTPTIQIALLIDTALAEARDEAFEAVASSIRDVHRIQGYDGNWNFDPYMHGLYNGLEMTLSRVENREFNPKSAPNVWLKDLASTEDPVAEGALKSTTKENV